MAQVTMIVNGKAAALSLKVLGQLENHSTVIDVNGLPIEVHYDPNTRLVTAAQKGAESIPVVQVFWFAWQAFYPETKLWK